MPVDTSHHVLVLRPKEKNVLFPVTSQIFLGSVGRQTFFFIKLFLCRKSIKFFKKGLKIDLNVPKGFKKVWVGPKILGSVG